MSIIRVSKPENPYTPICRETIQDASLSWEARGVLVYLLSKPDTWEVRMRDLVAQGPGGRDRMQRIIKELEEHRYLVRKRIRIKGQFTWVSTVYERPVDGATIDGKTVNGEPVHKILVTIENSDGFEDGVPSSPVGEGVPKERPKRKLSQKEQDVNTMIQTFLDEWGLPMPKISHAARNKLWRGPMRRIWDAAGQDANRLIKEAIQYMREKDLNVSTPRSIEQVVLSNYANEKSSGGAGNWRIEWAE